MKSQDSLNQDLLEISIPSFISLEEKVFREDKGKIYIGREEITPEMRDLLREQARYIKDSKLWEIMNSTIINEAYTHSLINSLDFEAVKSAKMLHHWSFVMQNIIYKLTKK